MHGRMNAIIVTVEPPISDNITPNFGTASAIPSMNRNIKVRRMHLLQPKPERNVKEVVHALYK